MNREEEGVPPFTGKVSPFYQCFTSQQKSWARHRLPLRFRENVFLIEHGHSRPHWLSACLRIRWFPAISSVQPESK